MKRRKKGAARALRLEEILKLLVADGLVGVRRCRPAGATPGPPQRAPARDDRREKVACGHRSTAAPDARLAGRVARRASSACRYLHIDPLKIDLTAVTQTMSNAYAERYRILPVEVTRTTLTVATVRAVRARLGRRAREDPEASRSSSCSPIRSDIRRYLGEFYNLARSMKKAQEASKGELSLARNFEQLVELGKHGQPRRQRPARRPHRRLALAVRVRAARLRHPHRAAARRRPGALPHRRRAAPGLRDSARRC